MKPKKACATCGKPRNHASHGGSGYEHEWADPRKQDWRARKAQQLAQEPRCALAGLDYGPCWNPEGTNDVHHVVPRQSGGTSHDDSPLVVLCRAHHSWSHEHPEEARELGLIERRHSQ